MITLRLSLDERRAKKDKSYPIIFRISANGTSRSIKTGFSCHKINWNFRTNHLKETHPKFETTFPKLKGLEVSYAAKIIELEKNHPNEKDIQKIKEYLLSNTKKAATVYSFWEYEIEQLYKSNRVGGAQVYKEALAAIHKEKSLEVRFEEVDFNFISEVEVSFKSRGVKQNTIGIHYRALRAIYNKAINAKVVSYEHYPFRAFKIKREAKRPRTITLKELRLYFELKLPKSSILYESWLLGKVIFLLIGINFKDLIMLSEANFKNNRVFYSRAKTKTLYTIDLLPEVTEIVHYFKDKGADTLFGRLSNEDLQHPEKLTLIIRQRNKVFNSHLSKIGKIIECNEKLTSYVFRYTWANIAKQLGYSKDLIAEALGHQYGSKVTGIYLEAYDKELVDEMNVKILEEIKKGR